jgi:hypothetical protein
VLAAQRKQSLFHLVRMLVCGGLVLLGGIGHRSDLIKVEAAFGAPSCDA